MKIILKEDVEKLGSAGSVVEVADGYARNFLIPRGMALQATARNMKVLEHEKKVIAERVKKERKEAEQLANRLNETSVTIPVQVGEEEKLFGSVTSKDIAEALAKEGMSIEKKKIQLEEPIKELGTFAVPVKIRADITAHVKVWVVKAS